MAIRKILVPLSGRYDPADPESLERPALQTAFAVGRRLDAHVEVVCIAAEHRDPGRRLAPWVPHLAIEDILNAIDEESGNRQVRARDLFEAVAESFNAPRGADPDPQGGFSARFLDEAGDVGTTLAIRGRLADLIVTACPPLEADGGVPPLLEVALRETGRPVLISRQIGDTFGETVAVAWNGSAEATRAVALAMDFLVRAKEVVLISVNENGPVQPDNDSLAEYLAWHGVRSRCITVDGTIHSSGALVAQQVAECGADMLVMGAYTRDRVRRVIFGGVTGEILDRMPVPVLMVD